MFINKHLENAVSGEADTLEVGGVERKGTETPRKQSKSIILISKEKKRTGKLPKR